MVYRVIGLMSGSSLDGLDIAFVQFHENAGKWNFEIIQTACYEYNNPWKKKLQEATLLNALDYQLLHAEYGNYIGEQVNRFVDAHNLHYQVQLISSHGHTTFHVPDKKMTAQLGDGASIAAATGINVVSDLRAIDVALGGQGAPIVPIGEKLLFSGIDFFLNLGGIANISQKKNNEFIGFDVCPANRVLNMLANNVGKNFDEDGKLATQGNINKNLLKELNGLEYYGYPYPKSLANNFGTDIVYPIIEKSNCSVEDGLRTYTEHIIHQIKLSVNKLLQNNNAPASENDQRPTTNHQLLVTGGGAMNTFLVERLKQTFAELNVEVIVPEKNIVQYKEALIMALIGVLRWREETNILASVTGAKRNSIGGAVWIGQEA
ncbi:MAG: anhydro-N-acetylmuramic acid kinase [Bacteroidetes bacterium]|nr:anhydro-N-acetylmuramic acid kinase [Bacteroidota bacterium]